MSHEYLELYSPAAFRRRRKEQRTALLIGSQAKDIIAPFAYDVLIAADSDVIGAPIHSVIVSETIEKIAEVVKEMKKNNLPVRPLPPAEKLRRMVTEWVRLELSSRTEGGE